MMRPKLSIKNGWKTLVALGHVTARFVKLDASPLNSPWPFFLPLALALGRTGTLRLRWPSQAVYFFFLWIFPPPAFPSPPKMSPRGANPCRSPFFPVIGLKLVPLTSQPRRSPSPNLPFFLAQDASAAKHPLIGKLRISPSHPILEQTLFPKANLRPPSFFLR